MQEDLKLYGNQLNYMTTWWTVGKFLVLVQLICKIIDTNTRLYSWNASITIYPDENSSFTMAPSTRTSMGSTRDVHGCCT